MHLFKRKLAEPAATSRTIYFRNNDVVLQGQGEKRMIFYLPVYSFLLHCSQTILLASLLFIYADKHFRLHLFALNCLFELFCIIG